MPIPKFGVGGNSMANARALGAAGERAAGITGPKTGIMINGKMRFPDAITESALIEVKNVKSLNFTKQLRDYQTIAQQRNLNFILYTRANTTLSGPLKNAISNGSITHKIISR